ncbi:hypothetical protein ACFLTD_00155 [Elusimicrobiota bacterium]
MSLGCMSFLLKDHQDYSLPVTVLNEIINRISLAKSNPVPEPAGSTSTENRLHLFEVVSCLAGVLLITNSNFSFLLSVAVIFGYRSGSPVKRHRNIKNAHTNIKLRCFLLKILQFLKPVEKKLYSLLNEYDIRSAVFSGASGTRIINPHYDLFLSSECGFFIYRVSA